MTALRAAWREANRKILANCRPFGITNSKQRNTQCLLNAVTGKVELAKGLYR